MFFFVLLLERIEGGFFLGRGVDIPLNSLLICNAIYVYWKNYLCDLPCFHRRLHYWYKWIISVITISL